MVSPAAVPFLLADASSSMTSIVVPLAIVLVFTGLLLAVLSIVRRRLRGGVSGGPRGFTLVELRELHRAGKLTDEEFARAKALLVSEAQAKLAKEVKPSIAAKPMESELKTDPRD